MQKLVKKLVLMASLAFIGSHANAYEVKKVCAKYQTNYAWSQPYAVNAQIYSGQELNEATGTFSRFDMFSHYVVIWWAQGKASMIKMDGFYSVGGMLMNSNGTDQQGRQWELSDNNLGMCI